MGGLPRNLPDDALRSYFERFGSLKKAYVVRDSNSGKTRGFGFLIFERKESLELVLQNRPHLLRGKEVFIKQSQSKQEMGLKKGEKKDLEGTEEQKHQVNPQNKSKKPRTPLSSTENHNNVIKVDEEESKLQKSEFFYRMVLDWSQAALQNQE